MMFSTQFSTQTGDLSQLAADLEYACHQDDLAEALRTLNLLAEAFTDLAGDVAQAAYDEGMTKKAIAAALGVPPSTFRGMERRVRA